MRVWREGWAVFWAAMLTASVVSAGSGDEFPKPYADGSRVKASGEKFNLGRSIELPDWLSLAVEHRSRYETLDGVFRARFTGSDQVYSLRTLTQAQVRLNERFRFTAELQDSRQQLADSGTPLSYRIVNAAELLEANVQWNEKDLFEDGSRSTLRAGRITMDFGKRRLVSRQRWRNTIPNYTGVDWIWRDAGGSQIRTMYTLPLRIEPDTPNSSMLNNEAEYDKEDPRTRFWGLFYSTPALPWGDRGEFYVFGLKEEDRPDLQTINRNHYTPGMRLYRPAQRGYFDYEWESVLQFGKSRATTARTDTRDLDHFAHFNHIEGAYTFDAPWSPRLQFEYDYASGDADPKDGKNGAFDTLFGPAVDDFAPLSIYLAFVRTNVHGPGARVEVRPDQSLWGYLSYRPFYLASATDAWGGNSGLRDPAGRSGTFLGHQWVLRGFWQALPNLQFEASVTYRLDGDYQERVPLSPRAGSTIFSYISATLSF